MSLDVSLKMNNLVERSGTGIYVRDNGQTRELSADEVKEKFPDVVIEDQSYQSNYVFDYNITHNLARMAAEAFLYYPLWRPEEREWTRAKDIIKPLEKGLAKLQGNPSRFKMLAPENGWGTYENLVDFVSAYLEACKKFPEAEIETSK